MSSLTVRLLFLLFFRPNVCQVLYMKGFPFMKKSFSSNHLRNTFFMRDTFFIWKFFQQTLPSLGGSGRNGFLGVGK